MYIIAIGWLYVTILMAFGENTLLGGIITFIFWGLIPVSLLLWLGGSKMRRQRQRYREAAEARLLADEKTRQGNGTHPEADQ